MAVIDRDRLGRLLEAVHEVDAKPSTAPAEEAAPTDHHRGRAAWLAVRVLGALAVLAVGTVHLQQYIALYSVIPKIGTLFVLNFAGAAAIALGLLAPVDRLLGPRLGALALSLLALGGVVLAATSFIFLAISEQTPLFGFMEPGYHPTAILLSRIAEGATVALLGSYLLARLTGRADAGWW
jgi:hypothetical protein